MQTIKIPLQSLMTCLLYFIDSSMHVSLHVHISAIEGILVLFHDLVCNIFPFLGLYKIAAYCTTNGTLESTKNNLNIIIAKVFNSYLIDTL